MTAMQKFHYPILDGLIESVTDFGARTARKHRGRRELAALAPADIAAIANDLSITQRQLATLAEQDAGSPALSQKMIAALDIDEQKLGRYPDVIRDVQLVCSTCRNTRRCKRELRNGTAAKNFSDYCPNYVTFEAAMQE